MIYVAAPVVNKHGRDGSCTTIQVPTFFLDSSVQGIVSEEHAAKIVSDICNPTNHPHIIVHANVYEFKGTMANDTR